MSETKHNLSLGDLILPLIPVLPDGLALMTQKNSEYIPITIALGIRALAVINVISTLNYLPVRTPTETLISLGLMTLAYYAGGLVQKYFLEKNAPFNN